MSVFKHMSPGDKGYGAAHPNSKVDGAETSEKPKISRQELRQLRDAQRARRAEEDAKKPRSEPELTPDAPESVQRIASELASPKAYSKFISQCDAGGGCEDVAAAVESKYGIPQVYGTFTTKTGEREYHSWNEDSSGWIVDAGQDVFRNPDGDGVLVYAPGASQFKARGFGVAKSVSFAFESGLEPVLKHPGHGNQKVHGRRGSGETDLPEGWSERSREKVRADRIASLTESFKPTNSRESRSIEDMAENAVQTGLRQYEGPNKTVVSVKIRNGEALKPEKLNQILDQVSVCQTQNPVQNLRVEIASASFSNESLPASVMGFVKQGSSTINLRPELLTANDTATKPGYFMESFTSEKAAAYYVAHEYGHVLDRRIGAPDAIGGQRAEDTRTVASLGGLSDYGKSNGYEAYAESYAEWTVSKGSTSNSAVKFFADKYAWGSGVSKAAQAESDDDVLIVDTFSIDEPPTVIVSKRPMVKHGDPSRPGYAAMHPDSPMAHMGSEGAARSDKPFGEWGDRAAEINSMANAGPSEEELAAAVRGGNDYEPDDEIVLETTRQFVEDGEYGDVDIEVERLMSEDLDAIESDMGRPATEAEMQSIEDRRDDYRSSVVESLVEENAADVAYILDQDKRSNYDDSQIGGQLAEVYNVTHTYKDDQGNETYLESRVLGVQPEETFDYEQGIEVSGEVYAANGDYAGRFERKFAKDASGKMVVEHALLDLIPEYQGKGFATTFNRQAENYYISHGIETIKVHAALDAGGYAWAKDGYQFTNAYSVPNLVRFVDVSKFHPGVQKAHADIVQRFSLQKSDPNFPTPQEVASLGWTSGAKSWPGKTIMAGANWFGQKSLTPAGRMITPAEQANLDLGASQPPATKSTDDTPILKHGDHNQKTHGSRSGPGGLPHSLGLDRSEMPQIPKTHRDKFMAQLRAEGISVRDEKVDPGTLEQTQRELNPKQTKMLADNMRAGTYVDDGHTVIASSDNHILDGHHRWAAHKEVGAPLTITRIGLPIDKLVTRAKKFNAEEGIEARDISTVTTRKSITFVFEPGMRPVLKHGDPWDKNYQQMHPRGDTWEKDVSDASPEEVADMESMEKIFGGKYITDSGFEFALVPNVRRFEEHGRFASVGGDIVDKNGSVIGEWGRGVDRDTSTMESLYLEIGKGKVARESESLRGQGIGTAVARKTEMAAREMGLDTIHVHAALHDGGGVWAAEKFGFRFSERPVLRGSSKGSMFHPVGEKPEVKAALAKLETRMKSSDPKDWPAPHEILSVGGSERHFSDVTDGRTYGEFLLSWGWKGSKPSSHVTKARDMKMLYLVVDSVSNPKARKSVTFEPVLKHPGHGDQKVHGRRGGGGGVAPATEGRLSSGDDLFDVSQSRAQADFGRGGWKIDKNKIKQAVAADLEERLKDVPTQLLVDAASGRIVGDSYPNPLDMAMVPGSDIYSTYGGEIVVRSKDQPFDPGLGFKIVAESGTPEAEQVVRTAAVSMLVSNWAKSSNDSDPKSLAIQDAAEREFGIEGASKWTGNESFGTSAGGSVAMTVGEARSAYNAQYGPVYQKFLRAQYDATQKMFADAGVSSVTVYRGVKETRSSTGSEPGSYRLRPLSSFSSDKKVAVQFAGVAPGTRVIKSTVSVSRVLSTWATGVGCRSEGEVVVLGGTFKEDSPEFTFDYSKALNGVSKQEDVFNLDSDELSSDWIKTLSWDLPDTPEALAFLFGDDWYKQLSKLPSWQAAPEKIKSMRTRKSVSFAFEPGLRPILKHGDPSRPNYAALHPDAQGRIAPNTGRRTDAKDQAKADAKLIHEATSMASLPEDMQERINAGLDSLDITPEQMEANIEKTFQRAVNAGNPPDGQDWYDEANSVAERISVEYGLTREQSAGMIAATSPQQAWGENAAAVEYMAKAISENHEVQVDMLLGSSRTKKTDGVEDTRSLYEWAKKEVDGRKMDGSTHTMPSAEELRGKRMSDLDPYVAAALMKAHAQAGFKTSDGRSLKTIDDLTGQSVPVKFTCGVQHLGRAVRIAGGESPDMVLNGHKVRSFYNNISGPKNEYDDVTVDSQAFSAAMGKKYGSGSEEYKFFAGGGTSTSPLGRAPSSATLGVAGLYAPFADAYRSVGARHGLTGRQMQAIVWVQWRKDNPDAARGAQMGGGSDG